jgi:hypothetical protein
MPRAYTRIDNGAAVVGNDWAERSWSEYLCKTVELRQKLAGGYVEWVAASGQDLRLELDGAPLRLESAGPPEWSESCNAVGAVVTARWPGPGWVVAAHTMALHENPGLVRTIEVSNLGGQAFALTRAVAEALSLRRDGAGVLTQGLARRSDAAAWETEEPAAAVELHGHGRLGLLLGLEQGGRYELFDPDPARCVLALNIRTTVAPGKTVRLARSFLIPYSGDPGPVVSGTLADLLRLLRDQGRREQEQAADNI